MIARLFIVLALVPAMLLAHLACACPGEFMLPPVTMEAMAADHACCESDGGVAGDAMPPAQEHAPDCPHCTGANPLRVAEASTPISSVQPIFIAAIPSFIADLAFAAPVGSVTSLAELPALPPPDLLRVKCTLVI